MGGVGCLGGLLHYLRHTRLWHTLLGCHLLGGLLYDRLGRGRGSLHGDEGGRLVGCDMVVLGLRRLLWVLLLRRLLGLLLLLLLLLRLL